MTSSYGLVNPYLFNMMGPYGYTTSYGDSIQFNVMPSDFTPLQARLMHGIFHPNHVSQWDPTYSIPLNQNVTDPRLIQVGMQRARDYVSELCINIKTGSVYSYVCSSLKSIHTQTETLLKNEDLNDDQKARIQKVVDQIKALEAKMEALTERLNDPEENKGLLLEELLGIEKEVKELCKTASKVSTAICKELKNKDKKEEKPVDGNDEDVDNGAKPVDGDDEDVDNGDNPVDGDDEDVDNGAKPVEGKENGTPTAEENPEASEDKEKTPYAQQYSQSFYVTSDKSKEVGTAIANKIYDAVDGWGTNDEDVVNAIKAINKDNVMETLDAWNKTKAAEFDGESMLESLYGDIFWGDDRAFMTNQILEALKAKADEAGVDISTEYNEVKKELDAWWRDDEKIFEKINKIHKNLGGKEYSK